MIEVRPLNEIELDFLLSQAPHDETKNLFDFCDQWGISPYDLINGNAVYRFGLLIDGVPIYFAHVVDNNSRYELWTVVTSNVKEQKTLYKYSKLALQEALKKVSPIYATMEKHLHKNLAWTEKMGFKRVYEDDKIVSLVINKGE